MTPNNPRYLIVTHQTRQGLAASVDPKLADGVWECQGGPFFDAERREWCQAIARTGLGTKAGEVKLKEPRR